MTPPSPNTVASNNNTKNGAAAQPAAAPVVPASEPKVEKAKEKLKPVTIQLTASAHQRLRLLSVAKGVTTSSLVESCVEMALRKDLAVALSKLTDDE